MIQNPMALDPKTREEIRIAISMRICYIETGDIVLRARELLRADEETRKRYDRRGVKVNSLSLDQMKTIICLEECHELFK